MPKKPIVSSCRSTSSPPFTRDTSLDGWNGYGLAVQAYQKRAPFVIDWLAEQAAQVGRRFCVRLVKGAYWDSEVKRAQEGGHAGYPVYTRKPNTDVSYLACARSLFDARRRVLSRRSPRTTRTPSPRSTTWRAGRPFEFQRLHGMGADLYAEVIGTNNLNVPCRVYAPVGSTKTCCRTSCAACSRTARTPASSTASSTNRCRSSDLVADPIDVVRAFPSKPHPRIPRSPSNRPQSNSATADSSTPSRKNSMGVNFGNDNELNALADARRESRERTWSATPLVPGAKSAERAAGRDQSGRPPQQDRH